MFHNKVERLVKLALQRAMVICLIGGSESRVHAEGIGYRYVDE
jgi:hypothetical protein